MEDVTGAFEGENVTGASVGELVSTGAFEGEEVTGAVVGELVCVCTGLPVVAGCTAGAAVVVVRHSVSVTVADPRVWWYANSLEAPMA